MGGTIMCAVDDSAESAAAAQLAAALAERLGLRLVLAHVVETFGGAGADDSVTAVQGRRGGASLLERLAHEVGHDAVEQRLVSGEPAEALARVAAEEGADLIVLGSRRGGLRGRLLRCALARDLESATPCPVVVAPPQTRRRAARRLALAETASARSY